LFDQLLAVLKEGGRVGFALLLCGGGVIAGQAFDLWPFTAITDAWLPWFIAAGLLGAGLLIAQLASWLPTASANFWRRVFTAPYRARERDRTVRDRLHLLTKNEGEAILWLILHDRRQIEVYRHWV
jgi:hypothetical protein